MGIDVTAEFNDEDLEKLIVLRGELSGKTVSPDQLKKLKSSKSKTIREGC